MCYSIVQASANIDFINVRIKILAATIILITHFLLALFLALNFVLIPIGAYLQWEWVSARRFRQLHISLMIFIMVESALGFACPLTLLEAYLRNSTTQQSFIGYWVNRLLYWNLPEVFFITLYCFCVIFAIILWIKVPPRKASTD